MEASPPRPRTLMINLHSALDLHDVKFIGTMDPYAIIEIHGCDGLVYQQSATRVAENAGTCPIWEHRVTFMVDPGVENCILSFRILHDGTIIDQRIGEVQIHLNKLHGSKKKVKYPVVRPNGKSEGKIIISHKFSEPETSKKDGNLLKTIPGVVVNVLKASTVLGFL